MSFGPFYFTTLFSSQTINEDIPPLQNLQFNLNGRLAGLDDFTDEHSQRLERGSVTWQGLILMKTDDGGPPLALGERGLRLLQRQASALNCLLDWEHGISVTIEGNYVSHNIGYDGHNVIEMVLFAERFDGSSPSRYLTIHSLSKVATKRSLRSFDAAIIIHRLSTISSRAPVHSPIDLRTVEWYCRVYKQSYPNFVPIYEPPQKYGVMTHISDVASALARHLVRPRFQDELIAREILTKDQIALFLQKAYTIWRMPLPKVGVRWGTWRKGIGGPADPPHRPKVENVKSINKRESIETNRQTLRTPPLIKAEERVDPPQRHSPPLRTMSPQHLSVFQSQPQVLPTTTRAEGCTTEGMDLSSFTPDEISASSDIDPEERELLLRIPLELFYPPPPPDRCSDRRFRWKCPIHGCVAIIDSASNYKDLFPGFGEVEAEWLRRKPESFDSEMGQEILYNVFCRHYEVHLNESRVDIVAGKLVRRD